MEENKAQKTTQLDTPEPPDLPIERNELALSQEELDEATGVNLFDRISPAANPKSADPNRPNYRPLDLPDQSLKA
jgi:hypothetical protein